MIRDLALVQRSDAVLAVNSDMPRTGYRAMGCGTRGTLESAAHFRSMSNNDPQKFHARRIVSERLQRFFATLKGQLEESTEEFWRRVESKLGRQREAGPEDDGRGTR